MPRGTIDSSPVTGLMDTRSSSSEIPLGGYRHVLNWTVNQNRRLCRATGWQKLLTSDTGYNNQDLHDQLLSLAGDTEREPITFLFEAQTAAKTTKLFAGTATRLYALNISTGNWKIIADVYGAAGNRWSACQSGDVVIFTNDNDALVYHVIDQGEIEPSNQSVRTIPDLVDLNITRAAVVVSWNDVVFLMNVVEDGVFKSNRIIWGDYQSALSFKPGSSSIGGTFDLNSDEAILAAAPIGNSLIIYTTLRIWEINTTTTTQAFTFSKRYDPDKKTARCLAYKRTLMSTGSNHFYMGDDGIYSYDLYHIEPTLVDYVHKGSGLVYENLSKVCEVHVGGYNPFTKEALFSWAKSGEDYPTSTFVVNTDQQFTYELDHGFNAFTQFRANTSVFSIRQFILQHCICASDDEINTAGGATAKEGGFCTAPAGITCPATPNSFFTSTDYAYDVGTPDGEAEDIIHVEDFRLTEPDPDSFCALNSGLTIADLCAQIFKADECKTIKTFVGASAVDYCLKQFDSSVFYRERATTFVPCGTWVLDGYISRSLSGALDFNETKYDKRVTRFEAEIYPLPQTVPSKINLRVGTSAQAIDPRLAGGKCAILWEEMDALPLDCLSEVTAEQHLADGTRPDGAYEWSPFSDGRFFYFELSITNPVASPADTGGGCCIARYSLDADVLPRSYG